MATAKKGSKVAKKAIAPVVVEDPKNTPAAQEARAKANDRAKARRNKVKEVKDLRDRAKDTIMVAVLNDDVQGITDGKAMMAKADTMEAALSTRAKLWELMPDGRLVRHVTTPGGATIDAKIDAAANGWVQGMAVLKSTDEQDIMTASGFIIEGDGSVEILKGRLNVMISGLRSVARTLA